MDISNIWIGIQNVADKAGQAAMAALPRSPFRAYIDQLENYEWLKTLNWIVPIDNFILIGETWLTAVTIFYIHSIILRWVKAIE